MIYLLSKFLKKELHENFPSKWVIFSAFGTIVATLVVYWYTAKAFVPKFEILGKVGSDYFTFIIVGELVLSIPMVFMTSGLQEFRQYFMSGTLEPLMTSTTPLEKTITISGFASVVTTLLHSLVTIILAAVFFKLDVEIFNVPQAVFLQVISWPLFLALGHIATSFFVFFGKGAGFISAAVGLVNIMAGVYFPPSVFPETLYRFLSIFSPFNLLLDQTRLILVQGWSSRTTEVALSLFLAGLVVLPFSLMFFRLALEKHRKRGASLFYFG